MLSEDANAGNYTGGSIAFVSNGAHKFSDISVSQTVSEPRYKTVENFEASADFIIPQEGLFDFGIMFNVQDTVNLSPGLSGFVLKAFRTKNTADNSVALQLIRYGTDASGNKNISLGGITGSTKKPFKAKGCSRYYLLQCYLSHLRNGKRCIYLSDYDCINCV